jgi:hypothetical protein
MKRAARASAYWRFVMVSQGSRNLEERGVVEKD